MFLPTFRFVLAAGSMVGPGVDPPAAVARPSAVAIVDVTVVDVEQGRLVPHQTVVIADGRVSAEAARAKILADAKRRAAAAPGQ